MAPALRFVSLLFVLTLIAFGCTPESDVGEGEGDDDGGGAGTCAEGEGEPCLGPEYLGASSQEELEAEIGDLTSFHEIFLCCTIDSLLPLSAVTSCTKTFTAQSSQLLTTTGLEQLAEANAVGFGGNDELIDVSLPSLTSLPGGLFFSGNSRLVSIRFESLLSVGVLTIEDSAALCDLDDAFPVLERIDRLASLPPCVSPEVRERLISISNVSELPPEE